MAKQTKTEQIYTPTPGVLIVRAGETPEKAGQRRRAEALEEERERAA